MIGAPPGVNRIRLIRRAEPSKIESGEWHRNNQGLETPCRVIAGEIGRWKRKDGDHAAKVNPAIHECTNRVANCACVLSEGLKNQDQHHFDGPSVKTLGGRYYEAWKGAAK